MSRPSNVVPFRGRPQPHRQDPSDAHLRQAVEALFLMEYLRDTIASQRGMSKRSRTRLHGMATEGAGLLDQALRGLGANP